MEEKKFKTFDQQIEILKSRNLKFGSEETAINALKRYGYYSIINGYKDLYISEVDGKEIYKDGTTFEQIYSLYEMDKKICSAIVKTMLKVEDRLKTATAYVIAETFSEREEKYLIKKNYRQGKKIDNSDDYSIDALFRKLEKVRNDMRIPTIRHYKEKYDNIPPWILFKELSFGNIVNLIKLQKGPQKRKIISLIYGFPEPAIKSISQIYDLFMDSLFVFLDYRNRAAHGGRVYNFQAHSEFRYNPLLHSRLDISPEDYRLGIGKSGLSSMCTSLIYYGGEELFLELAVDITIAIKSHCEIYPSDKDYLSKYFDLKLGE